jgi:outer membrane scaffolding protein for murein synthesis (MipA/OmpV family)
MTRRRLPATSFLAVLAFPCMALAQQAPGLPLWEIGAVGLAVSQQAYPGAKEHVRRGLALPFLIYRGEYLRADNGTAGIRALKTPDVELDIGFAGAFGARSSSIDVRQGMPDIGTLVEFGPRLKWHLGTTSGKGRLRLELPLRGVFDLNDHLTHRGLVFEPELIYEGHAAPGWRYRTGIGALWGNQRLADTFYGVAPLYATATRPAYVAQSGLIAWRLSASFSRDLSPDLSLFGFAHADSVAGAANAASPLVQRRTGLSVGLGLTYTWMRSARLASD